MKTPTEEEIFEEVVNLKNLIKSLDLQMGIGGHTENAIINKLNNILRMLKQPVRRVQFKSWIGKNPGRRKPSEVRE